MLARPEAIRPLFDLQTLFKPRMVIAVRMINKPRRRRLVMSWKAPRIVEVQVAMEINCYVCAKV